MVVKLCCAGDRAPQSFLSNEWCLVSASHVPALCTLPVATTVEWLNQSFKLDRAVGNDYLGWNISQIWYLKEVIAVKTLCGPSSIVKIMDFHI